MLKFKIGDRVKVLNSQDKEAIGELAVVSDIYGGGKEFGVDFEEQMLKELAIGGWLQDVFEEDDIELANLQVAKLEFNIEKYDIDPESFINIKFQEGTIAENGVNGAQIEDVIDLLVARLDGFQKGGFPCRENSLAITKLEEARLWLNERTRKRIAQGVEGKNAIHR
jgi:hypothetical protein